MVCEKCAKEMETVTCGRCGQEILRLGRFCYNCGAELDVRAQPESESPDDADFSKRVLCSDGTCIGVINEEGICKVCGKPYTPDV